MNIKNIGKSLYWRISLSFLLILMLLGLAYTLINVYAANQYFKEITQRLNANVAESMLLEVTPFVDGKVNEEALGKIMHSMMAVNPSLEVYLLDPSGEILSFVVLKKKVKLNRISNLNATRLRYNHPLIKCASKILNHLDVEVFSEPTETALSIFLRRSIPAITLGITRGDDFHKDQAMIEIEPLYKGIAQIPALLLAMDHGICDG